MSFPSPSLLICFIKMRLIVYWQASRPESLSAELWRCWRCSSGQQQDLSWYCERCHTSCNWCRRQRARLQASTLVAVCVCKTSGDQAGSTSSPVYLQQALFRGRWPSAGDHGTAKRKRNSGRFQEEQHSRLTFTFTVLLQHTSLAKGYCNISSVSVAPP